MAINHRKQWRRPETHMLNSSGGKKKKTSLFVYRWGAAAGEEESAGEFVGPPVTDRNWFCFLTLASPRWLAVHCLPGPFRPLGFPPFQGSSSVDDNTPRQAVWQCLNIPLLEQSTITGTSWAALTCPANWQRKPPNIQEPSTHKHIALIYWLQFQLSPEPCKQNVAQWCCRWWDCNPNSVPLIHQRPYASRSNKLQTGNVHRSDLVYSW